jgi:ABC-type branched-subunit amino acid transport system substrate-binding protein
MRLPRLIAALAATVAVAGACSSSGGGTTSSGPTVAANSVKAGPASGWSAGAFAPAASSLKCSTTASDPTRGVTDKQITVGGLANLTSATGSSLAGTDVGAKVRFQRANAEGGINGRKINYVGTLDDGQDPARNGQQAKVLAQQKKVFAAVPVMTADSNYLDTFCAQTVPFFGWGINTGFCGTSIGFGITGCQASNDSVTSSTYGLMIQALFGGNAAGKTTAIVGIDIDAANAASQDLGRQIATVGSKVVYNKNPIPVSGLTDTTAIVNAIMKSNNGSQPDVVLYVADFNSIVKLIGAMEAAGYTGKNLNPVGYDPRLATFSGLQKTYAILQWAPGIDTGVPAVKQMVADFAKYAPGTAVSLPAMAGYWAADMFTTAATKVGRNLTVNSLLKMLNNNYSNYVPDALPETRWPLNHFATAPCAALVQLNDKHYTVTSKLACGSLIARR